MVRAVGFEPTTLFSQGRCADQAALCSHKMVEAAGSAPASAILDLHKIFISQSRKDFIYRKSRIYLKPAALLAGSVTGGAACLTLNQIKQRGNILLRQLFFIGRFNGFRPLPCESCAPSATSRLFRPLVFILLIESAHVRF